MASSQLERVTRLEVRVDGLDRDLNRVRANLARTVWTVIGIVAAAVGAAIRFTVR